MCCVGRLCPRPTDEEVVGLDVSVDQVLLVYRLYSGELRIISIVREMSLTICLAVIQQVLTLNLRPHKSKRSSRDGPSRSITRML